MPIGKTHTKMSAWLAVGLAPVSPAAALGCLSGVLLSPDLDVDAGYYGLHVIRTIWGEAGADVWRAFWLPYAKIMPHRSIASHFPLFSTAVRLGYVRSAQCVKCESPRNRGLCCCWDCWYHISPRSIARMTAIALPTVPLLTPTSRAIWR